MLSPIRPALAVVLGGLILGSLSGCTGAAQQAGDLGSAVASNVASGISNISGGAIQRGMSNVAGGIDGALNNALQGAQILSNGMLPPGYPTRAVPLVDGEVLGGGAGPNQSGWVVQVRVASLSQFSDAEHLLTNAGFTTTVSHADSGSGFGLFDGEHYRVVMLFSKGSTGVTATYIVTTK